MKKKKTSQHPAWADEVAAIGKHLNALSEQAHEVLTEAKVRYKKLDPKTKKKIRAGLMALTVVAALAAAKKAKRKT